MDADAPSGEALLAVALAALDGYRVAGECAMRALWPAAPAEAPPPPLQLPSPAAALRSAAATALMERWARAADGVLGGAGGGGALARAPLRAPLGAPPLQLERMPPSFSLLTAALHSRRARCCGTPPLEPALCLLCGTLLCAGPKCKRAASRGGGPAECTLHAAACGGGACLFFLVHQGVVLLVDGGRAAYHGSIYLDAHGEEDRGLRRGKPLYLNAARIAELAALWRAHGVPLEVARARASASTLIPLEYF